MTMTVEPGLVGWLLEAETPSIRYRTLRDLLGLPESDSRVSSAREAILKDGLAPAIFARQTETGQWAGEHSYYTPKYRSTHWSMLLLDELGVDGRDVRFRQGAGYMLRATSANTRRNLDAQRPDWCCLYGNVLRYALKAGLNSDPDMAALIDYAAACLQDGPCRCESNDGCACAWGVIRVLWGLAAIPKAERTVETSAAIERGVEFLLEAHHLAEADYPTAHDGKVHVLWSKLSFPLFYQADILFTLRLIDELGVLDHPGAQPALDWLERRRGKDGRWRGASPYKLRTGQMLGDREEIDRWITLFAAGVMREFR